MILDKTNALAKINSDTGDQKLILGAGPSREIADYFTTDAIDFESVDLVGDIYEVLGSIKDAKLSNMFASHFFEHIPDTFKLLAECSRVLKDGGELCIKVPHFSNPFYFSDPTHKVFFGLYSFCYLAQDKVGFRRKVPSYAKNSQLELVKVHMGFKSYPPNYIRHGIFKVIQTIVNSSRFTQEFYEEILSHFIGCYEITYTLRAKKA